MKTLQFMFVIFSLLAGIATVNSAPISGNTTRIPQLTRTVKIFSELETELIDALKTNNQEKLKSLLAEDFEMRQASKPDSPIPYADWLKNSLAEASSYTADIKQMSVHDLKQTAIVNFLWLPASDNGQVPLEKFFIVDIWRQNGKNWQLAIRYLSSIQDTNAKIPGFVSNEVEIEKKY
jgi:hypothetical protein